jgi:hypothetical protein
VDADCTPLAAPGHEDAVAKIMAHFNRPGYDLPIGETEPVPSFGADGKAAAANGNGKKGGGKNGMNGTTNGCANGAMQEKRAPLSEREMIFLVS